MTAAGPHERVVVHVSGRVQGVGYRFFARSEARRHDLVGWVRNDPDGSVSVVAEGPRGGLESFVNSLREGPPGSRVRDISISWEPPDERFTDFRVRYM